jgi:hypothetical protein
MSKGPGDTRSSPFDRMLDANRKQFDALLTRRATAPRAEPRAEAPRPAAPVSPTPASALPAQSSSSGGEPFDARATDIGRTLSSRFGKDWRFAIVDKRRDGEDVVVWARLTAGDHDKTRRGRARIKRQSKPAAVSGSAAGADFVLRADAGAPAEQAAAEAAATDEAARQALSACAKGL